MLRIQLQFVAICSFCTGFFGNLVHCGVPFLTIAHLHFSPPFIRMTNIKTLNRDFVTFLEFDG